MRYDVPGVWRIDGIPRRITTKPTPDHPNEWTIAGDDVVYVDDPFGKRRQIMAQPIGGGPVRVFAQVPAYAESDSFVVDPTDGSIIYAAAANSDSDIELLQLARR